MPGIVWALAVGAFVWLGGLAAGAGRSTALLLGALAGAAVFLGARLYWADWPRRP